MRTFMVLLIAAGLGVLFYHQKHQQPAEVDAKTVAASQPAKGTQPADPTVSNANGQPRTVSEHNWMKRSIDRATEVRDQARTQTAASQNP
jgi:hypothetical protein